MSQSGLKTFYLLTLGCPKNEVDSEFIVCDLKKNGFQMADSIEQADIILINTCAFIQEAVDESLQTILEAAKLKKQGQCQKLLVTGCLPQRYWGEKQPASPKKSALLETLLPEVDLFFGTDSFPKISRVLQEKKMRRRSYQTANRYLFDEPTSFRTEEFPTHSAYVKIAEGCSRKCTFCIIPSIRGKFRSRSLVSIENEVKTLVEKGVVEVILVAQDSGSYGKDLGLSQGLETLLERLVLIDGLQWIRLMYYYPSRPSKRFISLLKDSKKVCQYIDIPIQHINNGVLAAMQRGHRRQELQKILFQFREALPALFVRTTLLVGFPGETEAAFSELLDFIKTFEFDSLGVFKYSNEEGAASHFFSDQVPRRIISARARRIASAQRKISQKRLKRLVGQVIPVIIEETAAGDLIGRSFFQAPEVDGVVIIPDGKAKVGDMVQVRVVASDDYDLIGEMASTKSGLTNPG